MVLFVSLILLCLPPPLLLLLLLLLRGTFSDSTIGTVDGSVQVAGMRVCSYAIVYLLSLELGPQLHLSDQVSRLVAFSF
jgi:hypothetical protein